MNIKADPTIVAAARGAAMAGVPFSMDGMYDGLVKEYGSLMDTISTTFEQGIQAVQSIDSDVKEVMKELTTRMNSGELGYEERQEVEATIKKYRDQLKGLPGIFSGDRKKKKGDIMNELNKEIAKGKRSDQAGLNIIDTISDPSLYDASLTGVGPMSLIRSWSNDKLGKSTEGFTKVKNEDGDFVYSQNYVDVNGKEQVISGTVEEIEKMLHKNDNAALVNVNERIFDVRGEAKNNPNLTFDQVSNSIGNDLIAVFKSSPEAYRTTINSRVAGQSKSFIEALNGTSEESAEIFKALHSVKPEFDTSGDGLITEEDFDNIAAYNAVKNILINPTDEYKTIAYQTAAKFIGDQEGRDAFDIGKGNRKTKTDPSGEVIDNLGIKDYEYITIPAMKDKMAGREARTLKNQIVKGIGFKWDDDEYSYINDSWYQNYKDEDDMGVEVGSADDFVYKVLGSPFHPAFQNLKTTKETGGLTAEGKQQEEVQRDALFEGVFDDLEIDGDDAVSEALNARFGLTGGRDNPWMFMPFSGTSTQSVLRKEGGTSFYSPDRGTTDDIMLYNSRTGEVLLDGKNRMRFKTGEEASDAEVEKLLRIIKEKGLGMDTRSKSNDEYYNLVTG